MYTFIMHGILTTMLNSVFLADVGAFQMHRLTDSKCQVLG
jgi:hypothetical protein